MYRQGHLSWEACILITSSNPDNRRFGTGFIVCHLEQKSYIITCAHVISDIGGIDAIEAEGQPARIVAIGTDDGLDLAVIETDEIVGKPIVTLGLCGSAGSPFFTAGFRAFGRHFSIAPLYGKIATPVSLESINYPDRIKAWNLVIERDERLHDGYSGSPVIDGETGFCLGVVSYKQGDGQAGLAVSIDELAKIWQEMPSGLLGKSFEHQTYQDRLFSRATQSYITGDLAEALYFYQRIQSVEPTYPRLDIMMRSVENEMRRGYVDRYGRVIDDQILHSPRPMPKMEEAPQQNNLDRARSPVFVRLLVLLALFMGGLLIVLLVISMIRR
jgi:S1-C subfamily serine protease